MRAAGRLRGAGAGRRHAGAVVGGGASRAGRRRRVAGHIDTSGAARDRDDHRHDAKRFSQMDLHTTFIVTVAAVTRDSD